MSLREASEGAVSINDAANPNAEKMKKRLIKRRLELIKQLSWTPYHAFDRRASSKPACTDVVCLLPMFLLWLTMVAIVVLGGKYGQPAKLLYGIDYELNVCGINNNLPGAGGIPLRFNHTSASLPLRGPPTNRAF